MSIVTLNHQQPNHICYHTCALFSDLLWHPRNSRRTASLASPALWSLALLPAHIPLTWSRSGTDPAAPSHCSWLTGIRCCCWDCHPVITGPRTTRNCWPPLDFKNLTSQVRELKEPCLHLILDPHKNSEKIINWHFLARGVGQYAFLVPNMKIQLTYIWKKDLQPLYIAHFYSRNKNNEKLTCRRFIV